METVLLIGALAIATVAAIFYAQWLENSVRARVFTTNLTNAQVRHIFTDKVATKGWKVTEDGNPIIAQSSLATGKRQQIGLTTTPHNGQTMVRIAPVRLIVRGRFIKIPSKAHTLRLRMDSFTKAIQEHGGPVEIELRELQKA